MISIKCPNCKKKISIDINALECICPICKSNIGKLANTKTEERLDKRIQQDENFRSRYIDNEFWSIEEHKQFFSKNPENQNAKEGLIKKYKEVITELFRQPNCCRLYYKNMDKYEILSEAIALCPDEESFALLKRAEDNFHDNFEISEQCYNMMLLKNPNDRTAAYGMIRVNIQRYRFAKKQEDKLHILSNIGVLRKLVHEGEKIYKGIDFPDNIADLEKIEQYKILFCMLPIQCFFFYEQYKVLDNLQSIFISGFSAFLNNFFLPIIAMSALASCFITGPFGYVLFAILQYLFFKIRMWILYYFVYSPYEINVFISRKV